MTLYILLLYLIKIIIKIYLNKRMLICILEIICADSGQLDHIEIYIVYINHRSNLHI